MKILMISHEYPPVGGGGANACMYLSKEYAKQGNEVTIVTVNFQNELADDEKTEGIHIIRVSAKRKHKEHCGFGEMFDYLLKAWPVIKREQQKQDFDICQVFFGIPSGPLGYLLKKKYNVPYVIRFGGGDIPGFQDRFAVIYKLIGPFLKGIWKHADGLVANSNGLKQLALGFYDKEEIKIICNGVDICQFYPSDINRDKEEVNILFVSRLIERKGLQYIIPQLKKIQEDSGKKILLTILGDGPYRSSLEQITKDSNCTSLVRFEGQKDKKELLSYYQNADLFILPSKKEGMPNVVLEAMAAGLPIVMTPCQGSEELVQNNGMISDINNFADSITELCKDDTKRKNMGMESRERAMHIFSWSRKAQEYQQLFAEIAHM